MILLKFAPLSYHTSDIYSSVAKLLLAPAKNRIFIFVKKDVRLDNATCWYYIFALSCITHNVDTHHMCQIWITMSKKGSYTGTDKDFPKISKFVHSSCNYFTTFF